MTPDPSLPPALPVAPALRTSRLAIASFVLGFLTLPTLGLGGIAGIGCGVAALSAIRKQRDQLKGNGFAIVGIVLAASTLLMVPLLAGLTLPALARAKQKAQAINCVNNMKQICLGIRIYSNDHKDQFPADLLTLRNELPNPKVLICPGATTSPRDRGSVEWSTLRPEDVTYEYLGGGKGENEMRPSEVILRCPIHGSEGLADGSVQMRARGNGPGR
ncbi:MAG TPA: hypothetical protein DCM86_12100 [Verrucomicrobiales bacterium]|nr:hypothetical protein [Verrucomicrobiales bacterium]